MPLGTCRIIKEIENQRLSMLDLPRDVYCIVYILPRDALNVDLAYGNPYAKTCLNKL